MTFKNNFWLKKYHARMRICISSSLRRVNLLTSRLLVRDVGGFEVAVLVLFSWRRFTPCFAKETYKHSNLHQNVQKNVFEAEIDELDNHQKVYWDPGGELGAHAAIEHLSIFLSVHFSFYVFSNLIELMVNFNLWQLY